MKVTVWLATRERESWVTALEILGLTMVLAAGTSAVTPRVLGLVLLARLGYKALTSLPMKAVPSKPVGVKQERRNQDLRSHVVGFLNEVRRAEEFTRRAKAAGWSREDVEESLRAAEQRMMKAAAEVVRVTGRSGVSTRPGVIRFEVP